MFEAPEQQSTSPLRPNYRSAIEALQAANGRFIVERSEEVRPGVPKREFDWRIGLLTDDGTVILVKGANQGRESVKEVDLSQFAKWQAKWFLDMHARIIATHRMMTPTMQAAVYAQNGVTPEAEAIFSMWMRETTGA